VSVYLVEVIIGLTLALIFFLSWYFARKQISGKIIKEARKKAEQIIEDAKREAETFKKEAALEAREQMIALKGETEEQFRVRRRELQNYERKIQQREEQIERRNYQLEVKEQDLREREKRISYTAQKVARMEQRYHNLIGEQEEQLQRISGMSVEEAKETLMRIIENEAKKDAAKTVKSIEQEAREQGLAKAKEIISQAIQRCASEHVVETTVSVVDLPNDEMKGRIIGREGRNIRALEMATGIDLIIDDTPEAVIISSFDPLRREIAKVVLERLITDGRIHPARIEEVVEKVNQEFEDKMKKEGETAALDLGIQDLTPELLKLLGKLYYRTSYGQNTLQHSKEVAILAGLMAVELGAEVQVAKRGGLLHDIGKAIDRETEGTHTKLGVDILKRYGERPEIIHCVEAHHSDVEAQSIEAVLVQAADTLSAARPGARREILENYIKRLEKLEGIADSYHGVSKAYAIQAGREIRIIVESDRVTDDEAVWLSKDIARRIEREIDYPGEIKVTVIRETRAIDFAK
jgi:ribonuclease Y